MLSCPAFYQQHTFVGQPVKVAGFFVRSFGL